MSDYLAVATLSFARRLKGGFLARSAPGLPFLMREGAHVALVPPVLDAPRNVTVARIENLKPDSAEVWFHEVEDLNVAEALSGRTCLMKRSDIDAAPSLFERDWRGWVVYDVREGRIGVVEAAEILPSQILLTVAREVDDAGDPSIGEAPDSAQARCLIPLVEELCVEKDEDERRLVMDLPAGLW